jgi:predicted ATPase
MIHAYGRERIEYQGGRRMTRDADPPAGRVLAFGPFRFFPERGLLLRAGCPVRLSAPALKILRLLADNAGELVKKRQLMECIWPGDSVQESTLRLHIAGLRRALDEGLESSCYVENVTGHGYRFIAPITRIQQPTQPETVTAPSAAAAGSLPHLVPLIGREGGLAALATRLPRRRLVTIVGPGGVGKTALAVAAAHRMSPGYFGRVSFVDLGTISDPLAVSAAIARALALPPMLSNPYLRTLLILDGCEHVAEALAHAVEQVLALAPEAHILATSRQSLRVRDESVLRLPPLAVVPLSGNLSVAEALEFSAVSLFSRRALEARDSFEFAEADVEAVTTICRGLDGLPLAIELAAMRADVLGVRAVAANLNDCLTLLTRGTRTASERHRSLRASLDWSFAILSNAEQVALRRLAVFAGFFDLQSASAMMSDETATPIAGARAILDGLADKSLLNVRATGDKTVFRLLHTTRAYALEKLEDSDECSIIKRRRAQLCPVTSR